MTIMRFMNSTGAKDVYTTREAAEILGVALRTVQLWVENGILHAWKTPGGHRRITRASVDSLLRQRDDMSEPAQRTETRNKMQTVLVVEDQPSLLKLYQMAFDSWGLPVRLVTARDGFQGLVQVGSRHPVVLITDIRMPGLDGAEMVRRLRGRPEFAGMKIIVVTALSPEEIERLGGLPQDVPVLAKPIPFPVLRELIEDHLTG